MDSRFPQKQNTSEKLKARQYGAAGFICLFIAVIMTVIRLIWGDIMLGRPYFCGLPFYALEPKRTEVHG